MSQLTKKYPATTALVGRFARSSGCKTAESHLFHDLCARGSANVCQRARYRASSAHIHRIGETNRFDALLPMPRAPSSKDCISVGTLLLRKTHCARPLTTERMSRRADDGPDSRPDGTSGHPFRASIGATDRPCRHDGTWPRTLHGMFSPTKAGSALHMGTLRARERWRFQGTQLSKRGKFGTL